MQRRPDRRLDDGDDSDIDHGRKRIAHARRSRVLSFTKNSSPAAAGTDTLGMPM
jgi:hypothetical protein